jgi:uncharacterized membrane protein YdjX (TVP38/TMEM64 family)
MARPGVRRILALAGFPLLLAAIAVPAVIWRRELWQLFSSTGGLRDWVASAGGLAPLVFVAVQALQVVVFVIPGEVPQIAGGYLFGPWLGTLLSLCGILAGSTLDFFLARLAGTPFVKALFPAERVDRLGRLLDSRGARVAFFLLFLIPGIPKDILCYVAGLSPMRFAFFATASMLGRLPGIVGSAFIGDAAAARRWPLVVGLGVGAVALFAAGWLLRERIQGWVERLAERRSEARRGGRRLVKRRSEASRAGASRPGATPSRRRRTVGRTPPRGRAGPPSGRR